MNEPLPKKIDVHYTFTELLKEIQTKRIAEGKESAQDKVPLWKLTKTITNMVHSNEEIFKSLCEVEILNGI